MSTEGRSFGSVDDAKAMLARYAVELERTPSSANLLAPVSKRWIAFRLAVLNSAPRAELARLCGTPTSPCGDPKLNTLLERVSRERRVESAGR